MQSRYFRPDCELGSHSKFEGSGSLTDFSLHSRPFSTSASSSFGFLDGRNLAKATVSCTESRHSNNDGKLDGSLSDSYSRDDIKQHVVGEHPFKDNLVNDMTELTKLPLSAADGRRRKLSRANMKKRNHEWALFISLNESIGADSFDNGNMNGGGTESIGETQSVEEISEMLGAANKKSRKKQKKKRLFSLPMVTSSLGRSLPLPSPGQIEDYLKAYDSVDLNTRSNSPQNSSSPDNMFSG